MSASALVEVRAVATRCVVEQAAHRDTSYLAVIHASDGVRLAAADASRAEVVRRLADYVRTRARHTLWPADARYVRSLLVRGELEAAVEVYFGRVGDRWDKEWLITTAIAAESGSGELQAAKEGARNRIPAGERATSPARSAPSRRGTAP